MARHLIDLGDEQPRRPSPDAVAYVLKTAMWAALSTAREKLVVKETRRGRERLLLIEDVEWLIPKLRADDLSPSLVLTALGIDESGLLADAHVQVDIRLAGQEFPATIQVTRSEDEIELVFDLSNATAKAREVAERAVRFAPTRREKSRAFPAALAALFKRWVISGWQLLSRSFANLLQEEKPLIEEDNVLVIDEWKPKESGRAKGICSSTDQRRARLLVTRRRLVLDYGPWREELLKFTYMPSGHILRRVLLASRTYKDEVALRRDDRGSYVEVRSDRVLTRRICKIFTHRAEEIADVVCKALNRH